MHLSLRFSQPLSVSLSLSLRARSPDASRPGTKIIPLGENGTPLVGTELMWPVHMFTTPR